MLYQISRDRQFYSQMLFLEEIIPYTIVCLLKDGQDCIIALLHDDNATQASKYGQVKYQTPPHIDAK